MNFLELYLYLHEDTIPEATEYLNSTWKTIIQDENHHIIVKIADHKIVSSCVCVIIPNLTSRPYALRMLLLMLIIVEKALPQNVLAKPKSARYCAIMICYRICSLNANQGTPERVLRADEVSIWKI